MVPAVSRARRYDATDGVLTEEERMVETIIVTRRNFEDQDFIDRLYRLTLHMSVAVVVHARLRGTIPEDSKYGQCLLRGSLTRMDPDEAAYLRRDARILKNKMHLWYMRGILIK